MSVRSRSLWLALLVVGCASPTEIVVVMTTELDVPAEIDRAEIIADADSVGPGGGGVETARFELEPGVPASLGVVQRADAARPVLIRVRGFLGDDVAPVVHTGRVVTFVPGEIMRLDVALTRACTIEECTPEQSCDAGACSPHPSGTLTRYE